MSAIFQFLKRTMIFGVQYAKRYGYPVIIGGIIYFLVELRLRYFMEYFPGFLLCLCSILVFTGPIQLFKDYDVISQKNYRKLSIGCYFSILIITLQQVFFYFSRCSVSCVLQHVFLNIFLFTVFAIPVGFLISVFEAYVSNKSLFQNSTNKIVHDLTMG